MPFPLRRTLDPLVEPIDLATMKNHLRVDITDDDSLIGTLISLVRERVEDMTSRCLLPQEWTFYLDRFPGWWRDGREGVYGFGSHNLRSLWRHNHLSIILPRGPVLSVESISYKDLTGAQQTLDPSSYEVDLVSEPARITPVFNGSWPTALWDTNSVAIKFICGYQQTVTDVLTVPSAAPYQVTLTRAANAASLTSVTDVNASALVLNCTLANGIVTVPSSEAGLKVSVVYQTTSSPQSFIHAIKLMCAAWYETRAEVVQGSGNFNSMPTPMSATSLLATYEMFKVGYPK